MAFTYSIFISSSRKEVSAADNFFGLPLCIGRLETLVMTIPGRTQKTDPVLEVCLKAAVKYGTLYPHVRCAGRKRNVSDHRVYN